MKFFVLFLRTKLCMLSVINGILLYLNPLTTKFSILFYNSYCSVFEFISLPESKYAVVSEISNASKIERNGPVKTENTDALF